MNPFCCFFGFEAKKRYYETVPLSRVVIQSAGQGSLQVTQDPLKTKFPQINPLLMSHSLGSYIHIFTSEATLRSITLFSSFILNICMPIVLCPVWCSLSKFLLSFFLIVLYFLGEILFIPVEQGWANILARGPHLVFKTDQQARPSVDELKNEWVQSTKYMLNLFPFSHFIIINNSFLK